MFSLFSPLSMFDIIFLGLNGFDFDLLFLIICFVFLLFSSFFSFCLMLFNVKFFLNLLFILGLSLFLNLVLELFLLNTFFPFLILLLFKSFISVLFILAFSLFSLLTLEPIFSFVNIWLYLSKTFITFV